MLKNKADIQVYNKLLFSRVAAHASLGMGNLFCHIISSLKMHKGVTRIPFVKPSQYLFRLKTTYFIMHLKLGNYVIIEKSVYITYILILSLFAGEAYMDGWWNCEDLEEFSYRVLKSGIFMEYLTPWNRFLNWVELSFFNLQRQDRA